MLIIPTGTDAPIYHWPRATLGLIILNVVCFFVALPPTHRGPISEDVEIESQEDSNFERYALTLGDGLHPIQWITSNFLHEGFGHLIGNMVFLWAFGIVVEGKLGSLRFLILYLAIGVIESALSQTMLLRSGITGAAVNASAIIFGLLAICMVWAPRNELNCTWIFWFGFRVFVNNFDVRYTWVAAFYLGEQILGLLLGGLTGGTVLTEVSHLSGAIIGLAFGIAMVKFGLVDCEGWDMYSLWKKDRALAKSWKRREEGLDRHKKAERAALRRTVGAEQVAEADPEERSTFALKKVRELLDMGDHASALSAYDRFARTLPEWPGSAALLELIKGMHADGAEADSLPLMRDYCRKYPENASRMRLKMAQILIRDRDKPTAALRTLAEIPAGTLPSNLEATRKQLTRQAEQMLEEGVLELEGED